MGGHKHEGDRINVCMYLSESSRVSDRSRGGANREFASLHATLILHAAGKRWYNTTVSYCKKFVPHE